MEYYLVKIVHNDERVGIGWDPKNKVIFIGGYNRVLKHITAITFKYFRIAEDEMLDKDSSQRNRSRNYAKITDLKFRQGLKRLGLRYAVLPCKFGIHKFT